MTYHPRLAACVRWRYEDRFAPEPLTLELFDYLANNIDAQFARAYTWGDIRERPFPPSTPMGLAQTEPRRCARQNWQDPLFLGSRHPDWIEAGWPKDGAL